MATRTVPQPMLRVEQLTKVYARGFLRRRQTFRLEADFAVDGPQIVGVMGPNGSGKTTLFELITGSNRPTAGRVLCCGQDIHAVKYRRRDRLAIHYHQSYQVRRFRKTRPGFLLQEPVSDYPMIHLFDEPQFNTQDGYIGFMLDFFARLRADGRLVFLCVHPNEAFHIRILRETCDRFIFVQQGQVSHAAGYDAMLDRAEVRDYLGDLAVH